MTDDPGATHQSIRTDLLRRYDALVEAAQSASAYGPLRMEGFAVHDALTGDAVRLNPSDGMLVRDELSRRWELVTDLESLLAKVAVAAVAANAEAFARLETGALEAITHGGEANRRELALILLRPRIEALVERAEHGDRVAFYVHPLAADAVARLVAEARDAAAEGDTARCERLLAQAHARLDAERDRDPGAASR